MGMLVYVKSYVFKQMSADIESYVLFIVHIIVVILANFNTPKRII